MDSQKKKTAKKTRRKGTLNNFLVLFAPRSCWVCCASTSISSSWLLWWTATLQTITHNRNVSKGSFLLCNLLERTTRSRVVGHVSVPHVTYWYTFHRCFCLQQSIPTLPKRDIENGKCRSTRCVCISCWMYALCHLLLSPTHIFPSLFSPQFLLSSFSSFFSSLCSCLSCQVVWKMTTTSFDPASKCNSPVTLAETSLLCAITRYLFSCAFFDFLCFESNLWRFLCQEKDINQQLCLQFCFCISVQLKKNTTSTKKAYWHQCISASSITRLKTVSCLFVTTSYYCFHHIRQGVTLYTWQWVTRGFF